MLQLMYESFPFTFADTPKEKEHTFWISGSDKMGQSGNLAKLVRVRLGMGFQAVCITSPQKLNLEASIL